MAGYALRKHEILALGCDWTAIYVATQPGSDLSDLGRVKEERNKIGAEGRRSGIKSG